MSLLIYFAISVSLILTPPEPVKVYEWRGTGRSGIYNESNLLKNWPAAGPKELWAIGTIGDGFVSPVFAEENFYISGTIDSSLYLQCYDRQGVLQWKTKLGKEWHKSYPGSRSAPTIAGDHIYVGSGFGNLYCLEKKTGKLVWSKDLARDFEGQVPFHGHSEAALIDGDKVFWSPGGKENNVVALDRFTGGLIWSNNAFGETSGYNSPKLIVLPSRKVLVTFSSYHLLGFDAGSGELLWSHEQVNTPPEKRSPGIGDTHSNTVLYEDGSIFYAAGDGNGGVRLDLSEDGRSVKEIWRNPGFDSFMGGIVKIGNYLYGCGTARPGLFSIDAGTGQITDSLDLGSGALIAADGMLYYYNQKGDMNLISYDNGNLEKISSFRITRGNSQHFAHPVISNGVLYQRHGKVLMAFDIKSK